MSRKKIKMYPDCNKPDCKYCNNIDNGREHWCEYILMVGESRNCECMPNCNKYEHIDVRPKKIKYVI